MALEMKQSLRLSQQLLMTPQLQQAIKLLQLNRLELAEHIMGEMLENPMLEETPEVSEEEIKEDAKAEKAEKREEKEEAGGEDKAKEIHPGEFINAKVDLCLGNDITAPFAIEEFERLKFKNVFDKNKIILVPDHFAPAKDMKSANQCKVLSGFAKRSAMASRERLR